MICEGLRRCILINIDTKDQTIKDIVNSHSNVFTGVGAFKDHQIKLSIDKEVVPIAQPQRHVPYHTRGKVAKAVGKLEAQGLIEKVPAINQLNGLVT